MSGQRECPNCFFSEAQYKEWAESARATGIHENRSGFCIDCLPDYKRQMTREGRCAHMTVTFRVDVGGFTEGKR